MNKQRTSKAHGALLETVHLLKSIETNLSLYCNALYCIVLHCTVLMAGWQFPKKIHIL